MSSSKGKPVIPIYLLGHIRPLPGRAACAGQDPEIWYPRDGDVEPAKAICATCPNQVRAACLQEALDNDDRHGIRGGLTPGERHHLMRGAA